MTDTPSALVFKDGEDFYADLLNAAFSNLDLRTRALEGLSVSYQQAIDTLNQFGLQRLNEALQPVYDSLKEIAQLGAIFTSSSTTSNTAALGILTFTLPSADRMRFAGAATLGISSTDGTNIAMFGALQSYDPTTGTLIVNISQFTGSGTSASWQISAASLVNFTATADSIGAYTKNQTDQAISTSTTSLTNALLGGVGTSGNTLAKLYTLITSAGASIAGLSQQLSADEAIIAAAQAAITNRLQFDAPQNVTDTQKRQLMSNAGLVLPLIQGRIEFVSATQVNLNTCYGNKILIGENYRTIQNGGVPFSNSGLSANTVYYLYAGWNGSSIGINSSTTGPSVSTTTGMQIQGTNDSSVLVGMVRTNGNSQFQLDSTYIGVISWANRRPIAVGSNVVEGGGTNTGAYTIAGQPITFISWGDASVYAAASGYAAGNAAGAQVASLLYIDSVGNNFGHPCLGTSYSSGVGVPQNTFGDGFVAQGAHTISLYVMGNGGGGQFYMNLNVRVMG